MKKLLSIFAILFLVSCGSPEDLAEYPALNTNTAKYYLGSFNLTSTKSIYLTGDEGQYDEQILWSYDSEGHTLTINNSTQKTHEVIDVVDSMDGRLLFTSQESQGIYAEVYDCTKIKSDTLSVQTSYGEKIGKALYVK